VVVVHLAAMAEVAVLLEVTAAQVVLVVMVPRFVRNLAGLFLALLSQAAQVLLAVVQVEEKLQAQLVPGVQVVRVRLAVPLGLVVD
jgi:hypothetical protein